MLAMALPACGAAPETPSATRAAPGTHSPGSRVPWRPAQGTLWQWQLSTPVDQSVDVPVYDIDMFDNSAAVVASLHAKGRRVICYIDAGGWEAYRPDTAAMPAAAIGKPVQGFPQERWLDIRQLGVIEPLMIARLNQCQAKGFDAVEPDLQDGYENDTGFPLTYADQITYDRWWAEQAHARGLGVALKGDVDQAADLQPYFDFALDEQCFEYSECDALTPFISAGKAVLEVEYNLDTSAFCSSARARRFSSMRKHVNLDAWRQAC
ncbi:MAG: endo alpha-1,4 polygalactosaminidase [Candidatus Dormibacteraeota bacterium]|nr:endo alpha-1,4 polygalactosaminidase [Candidatus Dormibacteraeota bacterium]